MRNGFGRRPAHADFHQLRLAQNPRREPFDFRRQRRGKKQRLPIGRNLVNDSAHVRQKSHVEHAIDLVEDENSDLPQVHRALLEVIEQTTRRGGDHVHAVFDVFTLFAVADAAMHNRHAQIGEAPIIAKRRLDLRGEFARRFKNQTTKRAVFSKQSEDGQRERGRLARASLRGADEVRSRQNNWERAKLNRRRFGEAHRLGAADDFRRKSEIIK